MSEKLTEKMADTWHSVKPQARQGDGARATVRDGGNIGLSAAIVIIVVWILHDIVGIDVPPEVAVAFGTVSGYIVARKLRY